MNVILITILLTILGVFVVGYFVWLGISLYKLMKFQKKAENSFKHLERWIDDNNNLINKRVDQLEEEVFKTISDNDFNMGGRIDELSNELNNKIDKFEKDIDGINTTKNKYSLNRFDKAEE